MTFADVCAAMKPVRKFRTGDFVKIVQIPDDLTDAVRIGTPEVSRRSVEKTFALKASITTDTLNL